MSWPKICFCDLSLRAENTHFYKWEISTQHFICLDIFNIQWPWTFSTFSEPGHFQHSVSLENQYLTVHTVLHLYRHFQHSVSLENQHTVLHLSGHFQHSVSLGNWHTVLHLSGHFQHSMSLENQYLIVHTVLHLYRHFQQSLNQENQHTVLHLHFQQSLSLENQYLIVHRVLHLYRHFQHSMSLENQYTLPYLSGHFQHSLSLGNQYLCTQYFLCTDIFNIATEAIITHLPHNSSSLFKFLPFSWIKSVWSIIIVGP